MQSSVLTLEGNIVISVGIFGYADEIFVINKDGYIGYSTKGEIEYAVKTSKIVKYIETMRKTGVEVRILPGDERFPDGNYIEDVAVLTDKCAIITNPGAESRKDEIYDMMDVLKDYFDDIEYIRAPGELEGGDIMRVGDHFYIGQSKRTNKEGADQLIAILKKYGYNGSTIPVTEFLHLKTGITYMEDGNMLAIGEHTRNKEFTEKYNVIEIPGYEVLETPMTEFEKMEHSIPERIILESRLKMV